MISDDEIVETLAAILSFGQRNRYALPVLERRIAKSPFFHAIKDGYEDPILYEGCDPLLHSLFPDADFSRGTEVMFSQCSWLAELYVRLFRQSGMTFEALFLVLPLKRGYGLFPLYHEMDFSQAIHVFESAIEKKSLLALAMEQKAIDTRQLAEACGLSYAMVSALRIRKKDIRKVSACSYLRLCKALGVRPETLLCDTYPDEKQ